MFLNQAENDKIRDKKSNLPMNVETYTRDY